MPPVLVEEVCIGTCSSSSLTRSLLKQPNMYVTVACVHGAGGPDVDCAVAGHLPILQAPAGVVEEVTTPQLAVGMFEEASFASTRVECRSGDVLALLTDGLVQVFDTANRELGFEWAKSAVAAVADRPLPEIADHLLAGARAARRPDRPADPARRSRHARLTGGTIVALRVPEVGMASTQPLTSLTLSSDELLAHWQGHRRLTRRVVEKFHERELFEYSVGGMRPFAALALEMQVMAAGGIQGLATRTWPDRDDPGARARLAATKDDLLKLWDTTTHQIDAAWAQIPPGRLEETDRAFGMWEGKVYGFLLYFIENEIHHRGQGYVYLRSLGIEPPPFYER